MNHKRMIKFLPLGIITFMTLDNSITLNITGVPHLTNALLNAKSEAHMYTRIQK